MPREEVTPAPTERPEGLWVDALLAIPNGLNDSASMGYDEWFRVVCGIHAETGGSPEGLRWRRTGARGLRSTTPRS